MYQINWTRLLLGGLIATVICFVGDGLFHERVVYADWKAVYDGLRAATPEEQPSALFYFFLFELGRGFLSIALYVLMRPCSGPGPKTAVLAGVVAWLAFSLTGPAQFIPLGLYSHALWMKVGAFQLITSIIGAIAGAAIYKEVTE